MDEEIRLGPRLVWESGEVASRNVMNAAESNELSTLRRNLDEALKRLATARGRDALEAEAEVKVAQAALTKGLRPVSVKAISARAQAEREIQRQEATQDYLVAKRDDDHAAMVAAAKRLAGLGG